MLYPFINSQIFTRYLNMHPYRPPPEGVHDDSLRLMALILYCFIWLVEQLDAAAESLIAYRVCRIILVIIMLVDYLVCGQ